MPTQNNETPMLPQDEEGITGQKQEIIDVVNDAVASGDIKTPAKLEVEDITALTDEQLNGLKCGDVVVKLTGNLKHSYKVTYKEEEQGICISYFACGYTETVAYDFVDGHWVFNSTDIKVIEDVIANPNLEGGEAELKSIQVGDTKYKVEDKIHNITFTNVPARALDTDLSPATWDTVDFLMRIMLPESNLQELFDRLSEMLQVEITADNFASVINALPLLTKDTLLYGLFAYCGYVGYLQKDIQLTAYSASEGTIIITQFVNDRIDDAPVSYPVGRGMLLNPILFACNSTDNVVGLNTDDPFDFTVILDD